jgi:hypothetical protein
MITLLSAASGPASQEFIQMYSKIARESISQQTVLSYLSGSA